MFKRILLLLLLASSAFGQNLGNGPQTIQVTQVGGGSSGSIVGGNITTFGYYTNIATNTVYTNPNASPEVVVLNLSEIGTISTPGYAQIVINSGGPGNPSQLANYNTNQVSGFFPAMIPSGATWFLSFQTVGGATVSFINAFIYGTTIGSLSAGVIATPVSITNGGTGQTTASAAWQALSTNNVGLVNIKSFGALGGTNNDTAAFQTALNSGLAVFVDPSLTYTVSNLFLTNNSCLIGANSVIHFNTGATGYQFLGVAGLSNIWLEGLVLDGQQTGFNGLAAGQGISAPWSFSADLFSIAQSVTVNRSALALDVSGQNVVVTHCKFMNFSDAGLRTFGSVAFPQPQTIFMRIDTCSAQLCWEGFSFTTNSEYITALNLETSFCGRGLDIEAGNINITGGQDTMDGVSVYIEGNGVNNPAHGVVSSRTINHSRIYAILCQNFNNGEEFVNDIMEGSGSIAITNCTGVTIKGGVFNTGALDQFLTWKVLCDSGGNNLSGVNYFMPDYMPNTMVIVTTNSGQLATRFSLNPIQSGATNLSAATTATIPFRQNMPDTNYNVHLQGYSAALLSPAVTAQTKSNFAISMTAFTGGLEWTVSARTNNGGL